MKAIYEVYERTLKDQSLASSDGFEDVAEPFTASGQTSDGTDLDLAGHWKPSTLRSHFPLRLYPEAK